MLVRIAASGSPIFARNSREEDVMTAIVTYVLAHVLFAVRVEQ